MRVKHWLEQHPFWLGIIFATTSYGYALVRYLAGPRVTPAFRFMDCLVLVAMYWVYVGIVWIVFGPFSNLLKKLLGMTK